LGEVRTLIYTINTIEGFDRQLRKVTQNKGVFPADYSLLKMPYLAMMDISQKNGLNATEAGGGSILSFQVSLLIDYRVNCLTFTWTQATIIL
jgi:hypothetical protein